jgi:hypothetical protein
LTVPSAREYQERYCAFVDILGFRNLISSLPREGRSHQALKTLLTKIHQPPQGKINFHASDFRAQSISDAVALSTTTTAEGLVHLFSVLERLTFDLLFEGYLIRGAIVRGNLYHDEKMVFGKALIDAYDLETNIVKYPRIMLGRQVVEDALSSKWSERLKRHIRQSTDGPFHLHVLRKIRRRHFGRTGKEA